MKTNRILSCVAIVVLVGGAIVGCSRGPSEEEIALANLQAAYATIQEQYDVLTQTRADIVTLSASIAEVEAVDEAKRTDEQKAMLEEAQVKLGELTATQDTTFEDMQGNIADFLNTALNDFPAAPETKSALDIYSEEAILVANDMVAKAGDYKKAIDHLSATGSLYDQAGLPQYQPLADRMTELDEWRFITQERFDEVKKNMTKDEVKAIAGVPYYQNIQEDQKRGVTTWLFRKREGGAAAVYFKMKNEKVYNKNWDAIKTKVVE
jgi:hypothetical protein